MIEIKTGTKKAQEIIENYENLPSMREYGLNTLYRTYSTAKEKAYNDCIRRALNYGRIIDITGTGNNFNFTLYILVDCGNDEKIIIKETASNTFITRYERR